MQKGNNDIPPVYIVILNYKNWHEVIECLESVYRSKYDHFKVFVIDNDSQNNSLQQIMSWASHSPMVSSMTQGAFNVTQGDHIENFATLPSLIFIQNEKNTGFAGGNNTVLRVLADLDAYIWLLNPDMVIADNALSELVHFAQTHPADSIIGSVIKFQDRPDKIHMYGGGRVRFTSGTSSLIKEPDEVNGLDYISGGALFTHARSFRDIGLLPEDYFLYWEETDWCYGAKLRGHPMAVCMTSVCYDKVGTTIGRGFLAEYYYTRNGLLFLLKYKKKNVWLAIFLSFVRILKKTLMGQWDRAKGVFRGVESFMKMISHENE